MRRVAVTGMGCVTPVGNDVASFWESLVAGRHGIAPITRFDTEGLKVRLAAEVKSFEPLRYMEKSELRHLDLFAQYAIAAAAQAMEQSGLAGTVEPERFGVYIGSAIGGIGTFISETEKMLTKGPQRVSPFFIPMMIANMGSAQIALRHHAQGPCLPVVTACATANHSIGEAFRAIKFGYADAVLAGGAEACITPLSLAGFTNCMALSASSDPDSASIPFDKRRSGFVMGEGAGVLVLEELERAKARGAHIFCELCGYGNTCDAYHVTAPDPEGRGGAEMIRLAFGEAGITPDAGLYINPHGTSTPLGDKAETLAIKKALGDMAPRVPVSSTKSMTGHMLGAAGGAEAVAAVMALETGIVPPTVGYREADPECDLDYVPNCAQKRDIDKALSLSLGFGGHNAGILFRKV